MRTPSPLAQEVLGKRQGSGPRQADDGRNRCRDCGCKPRSPRCLQALANASSRTRYQRDRFRDAPAVGTARPGVLAGRQWHHSVLRQYGRAVRVRRDPPTARLKRDAQHIEQVLQTLQRGHWVRPEQRVTACTDPDDRVCGVRVRGLPRERQHQRLPKHLAKHVNRHATGISADSAPVPFVTKLVTSRVNNCYPEKFNV